MGWLDLVVAGLVAGFGLALVLIIAIEGATAIELGLVVILFGAGTLRWLNTSWGWDRSAAGDNDGRGSIPTNGHQC
jgi:hypothetical protein